MSRLSRIALLALLGVVATGLSSESGLALPPLEFMGSRAPSASEPPVVPLPEGGPLPAAAVDSIIVDVDHQPGGATTRYDIFVVDLDGDGNPEKIVQIVRVTSAGIYSRCWWGIYAGGRLDQVLYWSYPEQRTRLSRLASPGLRRDAADSLGFIGSVPEFLPAQDILSYADLTGDGRPEIVVWMMQGARTFVDAQAVLAPAILSPMPDGFKTIFRTYLLRTRTPRSPSPASGRRPCSALSFRLHTRARRAGGPLDLLLEPWGPLPPDSLCVLSLLDERDVPHDPDEWMPLKPMLADAAVPEDWLISRWEGDHFGGLWLVRDVKLK